MLRVIILVVWFFFLLVYLPFLNYVGKDEIGIAYPSKLAFAKIQENKIQPPGSGWHFTDIRMHVSYIPLDTFQTILINGEYVRYWFKPQGLSEFLTLVPAESLPGRTWNLFGTDFRDRLRAFATDGNTHSFLGADTSYILTWREPMDIWLY